VVSTYPSEKYEFVSWDDDIPNIGKVIKFTFQTTNQNMSSNKKNTTSKTDVVKVGRVPLQLDEYGDTTTSSVNPLRLMQAAKPNHGIQPPMPILHQQKQ